MFPSKLRDLYLCLILSTNFKCILGGKQLNWSAAMPDTCYGQGNYTKFESPISLRILLHITAIYDVSEEKMEYGMQLFMTEVWEDDHIKFELLGDVIDFGSEKIPNEVVACLWQPDTIFYNIKESHLYDATFKNMMMKLVFPYNVIRRSSRYKLIVACNMDFHLYPMDSQLCPLEISLLSSRADEVELMWFDLPFDNLQKITFFNEIKPLNFHIELLPVSERFLNFTSADRPKVLVANLLFVRSLVASIVNTYIPSTLVVCLSMVSFWLDVTAVPGRVTLGVTAILTLSTEIMHARSALPTLDYMTAMDVWLLGCMFTVFMSLIEFTLAQSLARKLERLKVENTEHLARAGTVLNSPWFINQKNRWKSIRSRKLFPFLDKSKRMVASSVGNSKHTAFKKDNSLDRISRIVFPVIFTVFAVTYFFYFYNKAYAPTTLE